MSKSKSEKSKAEIGYDQKDSFLKMQKSTAKNKPVCLGFVNFT